MTYIVNPRVASGSIRLALQHAPDSDYRFSFVRNPFDRAISAFESTAAGAVGGVGGVGAVGTFEQTLQRLLQEPSEDPIWLPQSHFISEQVGELDFVGRFERLEHDWAEICRRLGMSIDLPRINASARLAERRDYYTPFACEAAARIYRADFARFGYRLPIPLLSGEAALPPPVEPPRLAPAPPPQPGAAARILHGVAGIAKALTFTGGSTDQQIEQRTAI